MTEINLIQKEAKLLTITVKDTDGVIVDVSSTTNTLYCKAELDDSTYQFTVVDGVIDKSQGATGILTVPLSVTDLNFNGKKYCILKIQFSASNIDKYIFVLNLTSSVE